MPAGQAGEELQGAKVWTECFRNVEGSFALLNKNENQGGISEDKFDLI